MLQNYELRAQARKALQNNWQIALLVGLIAMLPSIISQVGATLTGGNLATRMMETISSGNVQMLTSDQALASYLQGLLRDSGYQATALVSVLAWLIAPVLSLGFTAYLLGLVRMNAGGVAAVFSRAKVWYKAIGLNLLVSIKVFLWGLPGAVLTFGGIFLATSRATLSNWNAVLNGISILYSLGLAAMTVPMVLAALRYAMATTVLADAPETGVFACVKRSKELMQNRKGAYFTLMLSFIGWALLLSITQVLLMSLVGYVIASTVYMVLNLALQVYMNATSCEFYLQVKGEEPIIVLDAPNQEN